MNRRKDRIGESKRSDRRRFFAGLGGLAVLAAIMVFGGIIVKTHQESQTAVDERQRIYDSIVTEIVENREYMVNSINREPEELEGGVFRIVEVIPHEICSIFPYMIDWKTPEEYDKHVPIGYDGLMMLAANNESGVASGAFCSMTDKPQIGNSQVFYTKIPDYFQRSILDDRDYIQNNIGNEILTGEGLIVQWRRTNASKEVSIAPTNGYFEYVGKGKGLYHISASMIAEASGEKGIHYEMHAIPRINGQSDGELYVEEPAYFWPRELSALTVQWPSYHGESIASQTANNYELRFDRVDSAGEYIVETQLTQPRAYEIGDDRGEYLLVIDDINQWMYGARFTEGGNYQIVSVIENDVDGQYVRQRDLNQDDGYSDPAFPTLNEGYFRLYDAVKDSGILQRYDLTFAESTGGFYVANAPADWTTATGYYFTFAGNGKGVYDVAFIYDDMSIGVTRYNYEVLKVTNGNGRYALTSTTEDGVTGMPVYSDGSASFPKDYAKMITNMDDNTGVIGSDGSYGVSLGGDGTKDVENGGWVFVAVDDINEMEYTRLSAVEKTQPSQNDDFTFKDRIYIWNQTVRPRYYLKNGFVNNEWFKLVCYSSKGDDPDQSYYGNGYDGNMSIYDNLLSVESQQKIEAFDNAFQIEVRQVTFDKLLPEHIQNADLLFISGQEGLEGLRNIWPEISEKRGELGLETLASLITWDAKKLDISAEAMSAIYDYCIYNQETALIIDSNLYSQGGFGQASRNIDKLHYLLDYFVTPIRFAEFMPRYPDRNSDFTQIWENGSVDFFKEQSSGFYNREFDIDNFESSDIWVADYFNVYVKDGWSIANGYDINYNDMANVNQAKGTVLTLNGYNVGQLIENAIRTNVWEILHNRKQDNYAISVVPTNARPTAVRPTDVNPQSEWVIYADELERESFDVSFMVEIVGTPRSKPTLSKVELFIENPPNAAALATTMNGLNFAEEYTHNMQSYFMDYSLNAAGMIDYRKSRQKVIIRATDSNGKVAEEEVWIILREAFFLN